MKLIATLLIIVFSFAFCKNKKETNPTKYTSTNSEQSLGLNKYYVLIDAVEQTVKGPVDTNTIDTVYCKNDREAIIKGVKNYYAAIVSIETRKKGIEPLPPYILTARGWAVLDALGENVKDRVSAEFVDSVNVVAVEQANSTIANAVIQ